MNGHSADAEAIFVPTNGITRRKKAVEAGTVADERQMRPSQSRSGG
jgi:hypothetical protein